MPTYEYRCAACGHEFERFQKMSDPPVRICPECGKRKAERRISSGGGLLFKGPGFYATDYRKDAPAKTKETGGAEKTGDGGSKEPGAADSGAKGGTSGSKTGDSGSQAGNS